MYQLIVVRPEPPGQFTAQVVGIPDIRAVAPNEQDAISQARQMLNNWFATAQWVEVEVPTPTQGNPLLNYAGHKDPNDPLEQEYVRELERMRQEDRERAEREYEQECRNSSSIPTI